MNRTELTESQKAHREALRRISETLRPVQIDSQFNASLRGLENLGAAATLREVARLCMAEAARLDEEGR